MKSIRNTTQRPIRVPLPRGKKLHLGPGKISEIGTPAADHPPLKALVEAGDIEILADSERHVDSTTVSEGGRASTQGYRSGAKAPRGGDR